MNTVADLPGTESKFTPTEQRIIDLLRDGQKHSKGEMRTCWEEEDVEDLTIGVHVHNLKKKLLSTAYDIAVEHGKKGFYSPQTYRLIRKLTPDDRQ